MTLADDARALHAFVQAAKLGSFTAAAQRLDVTPATVSKSVAALEQSLGVRLFQRTTRSLHLTAEGERFFQQTDAALTLLAQAADSVRQGSGVAGVVRLSVSNAIGRHVLMPVVGPLLLHYPDIRLEVDFEDRVIDFVQAGYDLVLRGGTIAESSLVSRPIAPLRVCLAAAPDYLVRHGIPRHADDLATHRLIMRHFLGGKRMPWYFRDRDNTLHPYDAPQRALTLTDPEAITQAALAGIGIAEVPLYLAWPHLQSGALKILLADTHHPGDYQLALQYAHRNLAPRVRAVADFVREALLQNPALHADEHSLEIYRAG